MLLNAKRIIGFKVITKSGQVLGKVKSLVVNTDDLKVSQVIVSKVKVLDKILLKELIINTNQVIEIAEKKVIVEDSAIKIVETAKQVVSA